MCAVDGFSYKNNFISVELPSTVSNIEGGCFQGCKNLTSVIITGSISNIGNQAFYDCPKLSSLRIENEDLFFGALYGYYAIGYLYSENGFYVNPNFVLYCKADSGAFRYAQDNVIKYSILKCSTHVWNGGTVARKATCTSAGETTYTCTVCGETKTSPIYYPKTFTLAKTSYEYTGSQIKPTITITDSNGKTLATTNYTLSYGTNKYVGIGTVTVAFKGNYTGTKTLEFKITPKKTTIGTPAIASDGITVKWTKNTTGAGYYVYRSINGAAYKKVKTISSNATASWKDTGAKTNGYKYQYNVYAYKTVSGTKYYSAWSAKKYVTTK